MPFYEGVFDFSEVEALQRDIKTIPQVFESAMLDTAIDVESTYLPQLQEYPETRAKHPFQFAMPKSRRKYFAMIANGEVRTDGYGYVRNGGYARSWVVDVTQSADEFTLSVYSTFPASKFVGGDRQVPGHTNTGWKKYQPILTEIAMYTNRRFFETVSKALV